jgi:hypothetical protein
VGENEIRTWKAIEGSKGLKESKTVMLSLARANAAGGTSIGRTVAAWRGSWAEKLTY